MVGVCCGGSCFLILNLLPSQRRILRKFAGYQFFHQLPTTTATSNNLPTRERGRSVRNIVHLPVMAAVFCRRSATNLLQFRFCSLPGFFKSVYCRKPGILCIWYHFIGFSGKDICSFSNQLIVGWSHHGSRWVSSILGGFKIGPAIKTGIGLCECQVSMGGGPKPWHFFFRCELKGHQNGVSSTCLILWWSPHIWRWYQMVLISLWPKYTVTISQYRYSPQQGSRNWAFFPAMKIMRFGRTKVQWSSYPPDDRVFDTATE